MTMAIVAVVWGSGCHVIELENPAYNPQLRLPLMIGAGACAFWACLCCLPVKLKSLAGVR